MAVNVFANGGETDATTTSMNVCWAVVIGRFVGAAISYITEFYTGLGKKPVLGIVQKSATGAATNIIAGLGTGMLSTALPVILFAGAIWGAYALAGFYGVGIAASAVMANTAMPLAIDAFGPIADNAGGVAEMSELPADVREKTDILDSVGNTTAAVGKGFAIASAALTALALFAAYVTFTGINGINIFEAKVLAALFIGGMIPVVFSALAMNSVGKAAMDMVNEVRRQFRTIPGIMEGTGKPEYSKCVEISTKAALREMLLPGIITIVTPIVVNAKKSFEKGVEIEVNGKKEIFYKKSDPHKAAVVGDTVGDPFKDTSGPSMNILIKLSCLVGLTLAPLLGSHGENNHHETPAAATVAVDASLTGTWDFGAADTLTWTGKKVSGDHFGTVRTLSGTLTIDSIGAVSGSFEIDMKSIAVSDIEDSASNADLVGHLKNSDFFGVDSFPTATINIKKMTRLKNNYLVEGDLTIKGITNPISFPAKINTEGNTIAVTSELLFDRTLWNITYKSKNVVGAMADKFIYDNIAIAMNIKGDKK